MSEANQIDAALLKFADRGSALRRDAEARAGVRKRAGEAPPPALTVDQALDGLAAERAAADGISKAAAYDAVMRSPLGSALYDVSWTENRTEADAAAHYSKAVKATGRRVAKLTGAEAKLDSLARARVAKADGLTYAAAYLEVLDSPEGERLYAEAHGSASGEAA